MTLTLLGKFSFGDGVMVYNSFHCRHCRISLLGFCLRFYIYIYSMGFVVFFCYLCLMLISGSYSSHKLTLEIFLHFLLYGRVWRVSVCSLKFVSIIQRSLMGLKISLWEGLNWVIQFLCMLYLYSNFEFLLVSVSCFYLLRNVCIFHLYYLICWLYLLIAFICNLSYS